MSADTNGDLITRDGLLAKKKRRFIEEEVPQAGLARFRSLKGRELVKLRDLVREHGREYAEPLLVVHTLVDRQDRPLFLEDDALDGSLSEIDSLPLEHLAAIAAAHVGWYVDYDPKAIRATEKNSEATSSSSSDGESPSG